MENIFEKIDLTSIEDVEIDIDNLVEEYSKKLSDEGILKTESSRYQSEGTFDSKIWITHLSSTDTYRTFNFEKINDMTNLKLINADDYKILKCFLADRLAEDISPGTILGSKILDIFTFTQGFKESIISSNQGNLIHTYIDSRPSDEAKVEVITGLKFYLDFAERVGYTTQDLEKLATIVYEYKFANTQSNYRKLPSSDHIFKFNLYLNLFFEESEDTLLKKIYYPILIWWKVTNVIPMRTSELATQMMRDCLIDDKKDGRKFLKIKRIKLKRTNKLGRIPVLNKIEINEDIYNLIKEYKDLTDFTESDTLLSFNAMNQFKDEYMDYLKNRDEDDAQLSFNIDKQSLKFNKLVFGKSSLAYLLETFYDNILAPKYDFICPPEERLNLGDTRHLAFCSLFLQGLSPIQIAMLGGHTTLEMQDSYTNHVQYFIDNEVLDFLSDKSVIGENQKTFSTLKDIIFSKPWLNELNIDLTDYDKTEDGVGYCLLDMNSLDELPCNKVHNCIFCEKWWCQPTNDNYIKVKEYIKESQVSPLQKEILVEEQYFSNILKQAKYVNVNGLLEINKYDGENIKSQASKLKSKADKLAFLKASLIEQKLN